MVTPRSRKSGLTLIELVVITAIIFVVILILIPAPGGSRGSRMSPNNSNIRSLIQSMRIYGNDNSEKLPGLCDGCGVDGTHVVNADQIKYSGADGLSVEGRYAILVEGGYIEPEILLSPEDDGTQPFVTGGDRKMSPMNYSYSLLQIYEPGSGRRAVWDHGPLGVYVPLVCDRLLFDRGVQPTVPGTWKSYWSGANERWRGSVGFADGHTGFEDNDGFVHETRYAGRGAGKCGPNETHPVTGHSSMRHRRRSVETAAMP